jgi:hypothetical protein
MKREEPYDRNGRGDSFAVALVVLAASAVNSAVLLVRSACDKSLASLPISKDTK